MPLFGLLRISSAFNKNVSELEVPTEVDKLFRECVDFVLYFRSDLTASAGEPPKLVFSASLHDFLGMDGAELNKWLLCW